MDKIKLRCVIIQLIIIFCLAEGIPTMLNLADQVKQIISPLLFYVLSAVSLFNYFVKNGVSPGELVGKKPTVKTLLIAVFYSVVMIMFLLGLSGLIMLGMERITTGFSINAPPSNYQINNLFLTERLLITFLYPVIEELIFRGFIFNLLVYRYEVKKAILVTSVVFAIFHGNLLWAFCLSLLAIFMYLKKRSLFYPIIIHITNNLIVSLAYIIEGTQLIPYQETINNTTSFLICIALIIISIPGLFMFYQKYVSNEKLTSGPLLTFNNLP